MPLGFPSWHGLLQNLLVYAKDNSHPDTSGMILESARRQISRGHFVEAADKLKGLISKSDFSVFLNQQFSTRQRELTASGEVKDRMKSRLQNLLSIPWAGIITTNFDDFIRGDGFDWRVNGTDPDLGHLLSRGEPFLVKVHSGDWQSSVILTSEDYYETYLSDGRSPGVRLFLKAVMLNYHVLFIGSSLENRILDIRRELHQAFRGYLPNAWALVPASEENLDRQADLLAEHQLKLITYPVGLEGYPSHWCVDYFLELAANL